MMKLMDIQIAFKIRCSQNGRADEAGDEGTFFVCYTFQYKHVESGRYAKIPFSQFITTVTTVNVVGWFYASFFPLLSFYFIALLFILPLYPLICLFFSIFRLILISFTVNLFNMIVLDRVQKQI